MTYEEAITLNPGDLIVIGDPDSRADTPSQQKVAKLKNKIVTVLQAGAAQGTRNPLGIVKVEELDIVLWHTEIDRVVFSI